MRRVLIGHTGFVGSNLARQTEFDFFFNSKNIEAIRGQTFDLVVCSGAPAVKWQANKEPSLDLANINRLIGCLKEVKAKRFILISTVDVFRSPVGVDESDIPTKEGLHAYGLHRLQLEEFCADRFSASIVRLPALFGEGLKKNIIFDLVHHNALDQVHEASVYQFYNLSRLWQDIETTLAHQLRLVHFATEPVSVREVAKKCFGIDFTNRPPSPPALYDFHSKYGDFWRSDSEYFYSRESVLRDISAFAEEEHKRIKREVAA